MGNKAKCRLGQNSGWCQASRTAVIFTLSMSMKSTSICVPSAPPIFSVMYCNKQEHCIKNTATNSLSVFSAFAVTFATALLSAICILKHVEDLANLIFQYAFQKYTYYKLHIVLMFYCACVTTVQTALLSV